MWTAFVHGDDPRPEVSARLLKLLMVLNGNSLPGMDVSEDGELSYEMDNYTLGFAQSINVGGFDVEIVFED